MDLKSFFKRKPDAVPEPEPVRQRERLSPLQAHFVIGDLNGRADLLEKVLEQIDRVIGADQVANPVLCFVGNIIDLGPQSRDVMHRMKELTDEFPQNVTCLMGNREQMLLDFLRSPAARMARWTREGGDVTCQSFGVEVSEDADRLAAELSEAIGEEMLDWLANRPLSLKSGNVFIAHAGADPVRDVDDQTDRVKIWGHPEFLTRPRVDDFWVVHGHHVVDRAHEKDGRISLNTEAWRSGVASCVYITTDGDFSFLHAIAGR